MICSAVTLLLSTLLVCTSAQGTCDFINRMCTNGICGSQNNQQMACTCNPGFVPDSTNPLLCNREPPCNEIQGTTEQQCVNGACQLHTSGAYNCVCFRGYSQGINPNLCDDVDECQNPSVGCVAGTCVNVPGDYFCTACIHGYALDQNNKCQRHYVNQTPSQNSDMHPWLYAWMADGFF